MEIPNYIILELNSEMVLIKDIGHWDKQSTVTNSAELVVKELLNLINTRRLEYIDSEGERAEIIVVDGVFLGFRSIPRNP